LEPIKKLGISGSMSGWDEFSTDTTDTALGAVPKKYTMPEILKEIKEIKAQLSKDKIEQIFSYVEKHIHDHNNPHDLTLEALGTSVVYELYQAWLERGYIGGIEDFLKVLFQYVEVADVNDTLYTESHSKLVSVRGAQAYYDDHINDINAHREMFRKMFPGKAVTTVPVFSTHAFLGTDPDIVTERPSTCHYHDTTGYLKYVPENTLAIDYIYGDPMYSIWGERTNLAKYSLNLEDGSTINSDIELDENLLRNILGNYGVNVIREHKTFLTNEHGWVSNQNFDFIEGKTYTISVYAFPIDKNYLAIKLPAELNNSSIITHSLVKEGEYYKWLDYDNETNYGEAIILPNGWVRVIHTFRAMQTMSCPVKCIFTEILDGDLSYISSGKVMGALNQIQVEEGVGASPAIITNEFTVTRPATKVKIPFNNLFNVDGGTLSICTKQPYPIYRNHNACLYEFGDESHKSMNGMFLYNSPDILSMATYNRFQTTIDQYTSGDAKRNNMIYVHSYGSMYHTYGNTGNIPHSKLVADSSVSYSEVLDHTLSDIWNNEITRGTTYLIDITNNMISTTTSIDELTVDQILDKIVTQVYAEVSENRGDREIALIDLLERGDYELGITLDENVAYLYIGSDRLSNNPYNGYISDITYYDRYCDPMEVEYLIGEYTNGS